ncbi:1-aminocyclopropane-1-carboxylate synthase-like protein 1 [Cheilinus undulatus]|uniref:1-aminocyclopropane-1-carboxylate synthase-like protein 1 n=1 Tax=Cheilinus undulatus TaxID=241271 RepID=UPI001BD1F3DB|nr:1-aminocyclopropane-1-carboxylate synthase-like protein 1 [Cheilinus undulatus]XP_041650790.1 1-aminocyclopropane-1-carboxylate synthase-like protein 1 [Cheilinus undulatus]
MDFRGRRHERGSNWTDPEIVELLQLWSDESVQIELESSLRNQRVFDRIAHILREKGIYRTGDQCREKIKKMKLEYRRIKDNYKIKTWKFFDVMDRVLANRPAITYSSLGGAVIAQQVMQTPVGSDSFTQGTPPDAFGPVSSGGFLFGQPPKPGDPLDIKCEDVDESMLNSSVAPPEMYYGSGDDQETDGQSLLEADNTLGPRDHSTNARISPTGFSDLNIAGPTATATQAVGGPMTGDTSDQLSKGNPHSRPFVRQRKRRLSGRTSWCHSGARCGSQGRLDKALVSFLNWQQSAEERLLSMEETRLEREFEAEERREQREDRRAEQERQHELRLFSMLTGVLAAVRQSPTAQTDPSLSPSVHPSASLVTTPSLSSFLTHPPSQTPISQAAPTQGRVKANLPASGKTCKMPQSDLAAEKVSETPGCSKYLSNRGNGIQQHKCILSEGFCVYEMDKFHITENPNGIINLGTSENKLCYDVLHERLTKPDMLHVEPSLLQYTDTNGHAFLRQEVAKFLTHYCCSPKPLKADNVVVMNGCTSLLSCISTVICDPQDAVLISTPFYGAITADLLLYSGVKLFHVPLDCEPDGKDSRPFHLTVEKLEAGLKKAKQEGVIIRAILLMNPHNPLAEIYTLKEMTAFLEFAKNNELHAIIDELYMLTIFDESFTFKSVLSLDSLPDPQRTYVLWGMSKDFAISGMRIGTLYTENRDILKAVAQLGRFHTIPGITQHQTAQLLRDREWINKEFLPENRRRLKAAHSYVKSELESMGIPYLDWPATLYVWVDLRKYLREPSFEEELALWRSIQRHKVFISCGQAFFCSTPGWFRIIFAEEQHRLELGLKRFKEALKEIKENSTSSESNCIREGSKERIESVKEDSSDLDNAVIVNSASSPWSKSSDQLKEKDSPVPDTASLATEELVLLDCQASKPEEGLDSLIGTLRHQIRSSDWLEKNTPELSAGEDPEILDVFKALLQRARK